MIDPRVHPRVTRRGGSALLLCTLAAAALSLAGIATLRSVHRRVVRVDVASRTVAGRAVAEGLVHRSITALRAGRTTAPNDDVDLPDEFSDARVHFEPSVAPEQRLRVTLYRDARFNVIDVTIPDGS